MPYLGSVEVAWRRERAKGTMQQHTLGAQKLSTEEILARRTKKVVQEIIIFTFASTGATVNLIDNGRFPWEKTDTSVVAW